MSASNFFVFNDSRRRFFLFFFRNHSHAIHVCIEDVFSETILINMNQMYVNTPWPI